MERYFKIGEIAKLYGIGTDSIRYCEELGLLVPQRGENGYRMYSIKDIWRMNVIRDLRALGFPMAQIKEYLDDRSVDSTIRMLGDELAAIDKKIDGLARQRDDVVGRMASLQKSQSLPCGVVERTKYPARRCFMIHQRYESDEEMDVLIKRLLNKIENRPYIIGNTHIGARLDAEAITEGQYHRYDAILAFHDEGDTTIPAGAFLTMRYRGNSRQSKEFVPMLYRYAEDHHLRLSGEIYDLILIDIHEAEDYEEHVSELQARIKA